MENQEEREEFGKRVFEQFMSLYVDPEVARRQEAGELPRPLDLKAAQIIFFADGRKHQVRVNSEIRAIAKVKFKEGVSKNLGDTIFAHEIEGLEDIRLPDNDDPDCGHATLIKINGRWTIVFDLRYYKGLSRNHLRTADEFYEAATLSFDKKNWSAFVDNLFSCAELSAKVVLLTYVNPRLGKKASHRRIQTEFSGFASLGNVDHAHLSVLNKLAGWRVNARYLKAPVSVSEGEAAELLRTVQDMLKYAKKCCGAK